MLKTNVLITGGRGYVGGRLCEYLIRQDKFNVSIATRGEYIHTSNITTQHKIDWTSDRQLREICRDIDVVIHLAAMNAKACAADPSAAYEFNVIATARLLKAAEFAGVRRFVYLSTAHVYGSLIGRIDESTLPRPVHPYATSHRAAEVAVSELDTAGRLEGVVVRMSNAFGRPAQQEVDCWSLLINDLCRQASISPCLVLNGTGLERRNFISMSNVCAALHHLMTIDSNKLGNRLFNLGSNWTPTVHECAQKIASLVLHITGIRPEIHRKVGPVGEFSPPLEYVCAALVESGFNPDKDEEQELEELIKYCQIKFENQNV